MKATKDSESNRLCSHIGCDNPGMREFVLRVHPEIIKNLGRPVVITKEKACFCPIHAGFYEDIIFGLISRELNKFSGKKGWESLLKTFSSISFINGYGCWVTIHHCTSPRKIPLNLQMAYGVFEGVAWKFLAIIKPRPNHKSK